MPPPRKVGDRRAANWNLSSKNSRKIISLLGDLALTNMGLGDKAAAFKLVERAKAAIPIEKDALDGPAPSSSWPGWRRRWGNPTAPWPLYRNYSRYHTTAPLAGNMPLTPALLRLDPMFDPLRNDPRFQKLAAAEAPKSGQK